MVIFLFGSCVPSFGNLEAGYKVNKMLPIIFLEINIVLGK
jgi:hypothetical protein